MTSPSAKSMAIQTVYSDYAGDLTISVCHVFISVSRWRTPDLGFPVQQAR